MAVHMAWSALLFNDRLLRIALVFQLTSPTVASFLPVPHKFVLHGKGPNVKQAPVFNTYISQDEIFGSACQYSYNNSDQIGKGTFGTVYRASITHRNGFLDAEHVAVKAVHLDRRSELVTDDEKWTRQRESLQRLLEFRHDHLVRYHKVTIAKGSLGGVSIELMMDYHTGEDLSKIIRNLRQQSVLLSETTAVSYTIQIAKGLQFLHDRQIIHGDLKPGNILTTPLKSGDRKLAICDLDDIIQMERDATCSDDITHLRGTVRYMSPEVLKKFVAVRESETPGRKTDIWSLGCIMLELADCVVGSYRKWLCRGNGKVEVDNNINDQQFMHLIIKGYVPFIMETIPPYITACLRQCIRPTSAERISASVVIQQLKPPEFVMIFHNVCRPDTELDLLDPVPGLNYGWLFDPLTDTITNFPLPRSLRYRSLAFQLPVLAQRVLFQVVKSYDQYETILWDLEEDTCQPVAFPGSTKLMVCPVAVRDRVFFWNLDGQFNQLALHDKTIAVQKLPENAIPARRSIIGGLQHGHRIIYIGRQCGQSPLWVRCFDTVTGEWDSLPDLPDLANFAMVILLEAMYVLGSDVAFSGSPQTVFPSVSLRSCLRLDLHSPTPQWEKKCDLLHARRGDHCTFAADNQIYVFGGKEQGHTPGTMEVYDTQADVWFSVPVPGSEKFSEFNRTMSRPVNIALRGPLSVVPKRMRLLNWMNLLLTRAAAFRAAAHALDW